MYDHSEPELGFEQSALGKSYHCDALDRGPRLVGELLPAHEAHCGLGFDLGLGTVHHRLLVASRG